MIWVRPDDEILVNRQGGWWMIPSGFVITARPVNWYWFDV